MSAESVTVGQLVADTIALTNHLRRRFGKDRIYLMGHSGGSFLGMHAVARAPELYHAYIGVAQMGNQRKSEKRAYDYMLARCRSERRTALARKLEAAPVTLEGGLPPAYVRVRDEAMHALGVGTMREMRSVVTGLFLPSLRTRDYTLAEKINLWRGKAATGVSSMWKEMLAADLAERVPAVGVPVVLPARRARLHLHLGRGVGLLRQPGSAAQGVLHLQPSPRTARCSKNPTGS